MATYSGNTSLWRHVSASNKELKADIIQRTSATATVSLEDLQRRFWQMNIARRTSAIQRTQSEGESRPDLRRKIPGNPRSSEVDWDNVALHRELDHLLSSGADEYEKLKRQQESDYWTEEASDEEKRQHFFLPVIEKAQSSSSPPRREFCMHYNPKGARNLSASGEQRHRGAPDPLVLPIAEE